MIHITSLNLTDQTLINSRGSRAKFEERARGSKADLEDYGVPCESAPGPVMTAQGRQGARGVGKCACLGVRPAADGSKAKRCQRYWRGGSADHHVQTHSLLAYKGCPGSDGR